MSSDIQSTPSARIIQVPKHPLIILTPTPLHPPSTYALNVFDYNAKRSWHVILDFQSRSPLYFAMRAKITSFLLPLTGGDYRTALGYTVMDGETQVCIASFRQPRLVRLTDGVAADIPTCQKELEHISQAVHTLSLGTRYLVSPEDEEIRERCLSEVEQILRVFFLDPETRMIPEVEYSQCIPGQKPVRGNANFVISTRFLILVAQALMFLPTDLPCRSAVEQWFAAHVRWMKAASPQGIEAVTPGKKMERWYHAALASYLAISNPEASRSRASSFLHRLIDTHPVPSSLSPQYRLGTRPRHNTLFALEPLFILAALTISPSSSSSLLTPDLKIIEWLRGVVEWVEKVGQGPIEGEVDSDERRGAKIAWFNRLLARWTGEGVEEGGLEGKYWEKGWRGWSVLAWGMI